ncbi:uncharacterized protein N7484_010050 [Penicillium longicatenatum]|uniref:uncharacterized protein n=1 Tax=Penicillium longicatenatum TaxID=1561947 RepID=UPI002548BEDB|nr:uncharacterized protein N7484_010050 [Penicillium longicatenatum]KAJ5636737.1 hypothetical protein N7484_010050 [Penicillium longicatenatum]
MSPSDSKAEQATVEVNLNELNASKDAVLMRLMTIQAYIADLSKAYLEHANSVATGGPATIDIPAVPAGLNLSNFERPSSPGAKSEAGTKKRKRAPVDPNAPKRALTPYFLYMQSNRAKIAADLGDVAKPKDVADEGTRRWQEMPASQKEIWKELYSQNYEKYKADMAAYKAGKNEEDQDPAATQLQADFADAPKEASDNETSSSSSEDEDEEEESRESSPSPAQPPPKEKTPPQHQAPPWQ